MIQYTAEDVVETTKRVHLELIPNVGWNRSFWVADENGVRREATLQSVGTNGCDILVKID